MAYVHQLLDQPSQWQTSQQAGPGLVPKFTSTSITVKQLLIKNKNINQSLCVISILVTIVFTMHSSCILDSVANLFVRHMVFVGNIQKSPIASHLKGFDPFLDFCYQGPALIGIKEGR